MIEHDQITAGLGYELAFTSGLRRQELRSLTVQDFDSARGGLILRAEWTKNRKAVFSLASVPRAAAG